MRKSLVVALVALVGGSVGNSSPHQSTATNQQPLFPHQPPDPRAGTPSHQSLSATSPFAWQTWEGTREKIAGWRVRYPALVHAGTLGKTVEGREIPLLRLSDDAEPNPAEPEVLLIAGVHPREQAPVVCLSRLVDELLAGYGKDPRLTKILKEQQVWIVPTLNVDGKIHDLKDGATAAKDWRKNRRANPDGTFGVDLNRNFGVRWGGNRAYDAEWRASTADTKGNIYEGSGPVSEPEAQALARFLRERKNLRAFMDIHSPLAVILYPPYAVREERDRFYAVARGMQARQKRPYAISSALKTAQAEPDSEPQPGPRGGDAGITYTWAYYTTGVYGYNFELATTKRERGKAGRYPTPDDIATEYADNFREPLLYFLESAPTFAPATPGSATCVGAWKVEGTPRPGATVTVTPPAVSGPCDWAVLVSESRDAVVQSEYRLYPFRAGYSLQVDEKARPGAAVPLALYLWDKQRRVSVIRFTLTVAP